MTTTIAELPTDEWTEIPIAESSVIESVFALRSQNFVQFVLDEETHYIYTLTEDNFVILMNYLLAGGSPGEGFNWAKGLDISTTTGPRIIDVNADVLSKTITIQTPGSSAVESISYGPDADGRVEFGIESKGGATYNYSMTSEEADSIVNDLVSGASAGRIWQQIRKGWYPVPAEPEVIEPVERWETITVSGPADSLFLLAAHLDSQGFTVE